MTDPRIDVLEAELAAVRAEMQSLTATISHDLRAPLRHITSFAQLVQDEAGPQLNDEMREFLGSITGSAKTLGAMLDGLLALSRLGTVPLHPEPVDLAALVHALVQERQSVLQSSSGPHGSPRLVLWSVDCAGLSDVVIDPKLLRLALGHVLDNAVKFTVHHEHAEILVKTRWDAASKQVLCTVHDNGVGFAPEQAAKLFQPFVRLHSSSQFAGLGMGLALVRKCVQRMGGEVRIAATAQAGCEVVLVLPIATKIGAAPALSTALKA